MSKLHLMRKFPQRTLSMVLALLMMFSIAAPFRLAVFAEGDTAAEGDDIHMFVYTALDSGGNVIKLNGKDKYEMIFQKGDTPPYPETERTPLLHINAFDKDQQTNQALNIDGKEAYKQPWYKYNEYTHRLIIKDKIKPQKMSGWFMYMKNLSDANVSGLEDKIDTSICKSFYCTFNYCYLKNLDLRQWNMSSAETVNGMFSHMDGRGLETLNIASPNWELPDCTNFGAFIYDSLLEELDLSYLNPVSATTISGFLSENKKLRKVTFGSQFSMHPTSALTLNNAFRNDKALEELDLSSWNINKARYCREMFKGCTSLERINFGDTPWGAHSSVEYDSMFEGCESLETLDAKCISGPLNSPSIFKDCSGLKELDLSSVGTDPTSSTGNLANKENIFEGCNELSWVKLNENWPANAGTSAPVKTSWRKLDEPNIGVVKPSDEVFLNYNTDYAGTWGAESNINFRGNGGTPNYQLVPGIKDVPLEFDESAVVAARTGYDFIGWFTEKDGGTPFRSGDTPTQWSYYAHWNEHTYNIVLHKNVVPLDQETEADRVTISNVKYSEFVTLPDDVFTKDDTSVIASWNKRQNGTGTPVYAANDQVNKLTIEDGATIDLYAQWHTPEAVITFDTTYRDANGDPILDDQSNPITGTPVTRREYSIANNDTYGTGDKLSDSYLDSSHSFVGWYSPNYRRIITDEDAVIGTETLQARWVEKPVITFDLGGGHIEADEGVYTKVCDYNQKIGQVPTPVKDNCAFMGWFTENGTTPIDPYQTVAKADTTYYAHWGYQPQFNTDGGSYIPDSTGGYRTYDILTEDQLTEDTLTGVKYYPLGTLPEVKRKNYQFQGWYRGETKFENGDMLDIMNGDTLTARWGEPVVYTVKLKKTADAAPFETFEVYEGSKLEQLTVPDNEGKKFTGWLDAKHSHAYTEASVVNAADTEEVTEGGVTKKVLTLVAQWAASYHDVTFHANGSGARLVDTTEDHLTLSVADSSIVEEIPGAKWTREESTSQGSVEVIEKAFVGWNTNPDGTGDWLNSDTKITANTDYYAIWEDNNKDTDVPVGEQTLKYHTKVQWETISDDKKRITNLGYYPPEGGDFLNTLVFYPKTGGNVAADLNLVFEYPSGADLSEPGSLRITIPKNLFKDWNGDHTGTDDLDKATTDNPRYNEGRAPDKQVDFLREVDGDNYIITNLKQPSKTVSEFLISYTVNPKDVKGGFINENGEYDKYYKSQFDVKIELKNGNDYITLQQKTLGVEFHNSVNPTVSKSRASVSNTWDTEWGTTPPDADEYFYIKWKLSVNGGDCNQPYYLTWNEDTVHDGEVVYSYSPGLDVESPVQTGGTTSFYVVTKHRRDDASSGGSWLTLKNQAILSLRLASDTEGVALQNYRASGQTTAFVERGDVGSGSTFKKRIYDDSDHTGEVNDEHYKGGAQDLVLSGEAGRLPALAYYITHKESNNIDNPEHMANGGYKTAQRTYTITDGASGSGDLTIASGNPNNPSSFTDVMSLADNDYCFKTLTVSITEYDSQYLGDNWAAPYEITNESDYGDIEIYIRKANKTAFEHYDTLYQSKGGTVTLPENTVGFKVGYTSEKYTTDLKVYAPLSLRPSGRLTSIVSAHAADGRNTHIVNNAHMTIDRTKTVNNESVTTTTSASTNDAPYQDPWFTTYVLTISKSKLFAAKTALNCNNSNSNDKDYVVTDLGNSTVTFSQAAEGWAYSDNQTGTIKKITSGVFYDLLPKGYTVDKDSVYVITRSEDYIDKKTGQLKTWNSVPLNSQNPSIRKTNYKPSEPSFIINNSISSDYYSVSFVDNWRNSGQTMMIVDVRCPEDRDASGFCVYYMVQTSINNLHINGLASTNYVAFTDTTPNQSLPADRSREYKSLDRKIKDIYADIHNDQTAYNYETTTLEKPTLYQYGADSIVTTEGSDIARHQVVGLNTDYKYHVYYEGSSSSKTSNLIIYDVIERQINGNESEWLGTFKGIDVSSIEERVSATGSGNCVPRVYYSVQPRDDFTKEDFDIAKREAELLGETEADGKLWFKTPPSDLSRVTAVAVDCRYSNGTKDNNFVLKVQDGIDFTIKMLSTSDESYVGKVTYNEACVSGFNMDIGTDIKSSARTSVQLKYTPPRFVKNAFPVSGTEAAPEGVVINSVLDYVLKITNPDADVAMYNVVVEDVFPDTLKLNNTITVKFGKGKEIAIDDSAHVTGSITPIYSDPPQNTTISSRKFSATIDCLNAGETVEIKIPVQVTAAKNTLLVNQAKVVSVNGTDQDIPSEQTTYHIVTGYQAKVLKIKPSGEPLAGAKLQIFEKNETNCDSDGNLKPGAVPITLNYNDPVDPSITHNLDKDYFVSRDTPWSFNLTHVGDYILHEVVDGVPAGYIHAADVTFTIDNEGIINVDGKPVSYVTLVDDAPFTIVYHANHPSMTGDEDIYKVVESNSLENGKVEAFDDFPQLENNRFTSFTGWYHNDDFSEVTDDVTANTTRRASFDETYDESQPVYHLYAHWQDYKVIFHENSPQSGANRDAVFTLNNKKYEFYNKENGAVGDSNKFYLERFKVNHFYEIPSFAGDEYVFAGWYYATDFAKDADGADTPVDFENQSYPKRDGLADPDYHLYAKWIEVGNVAQDPADTNARGSTNSTYRGFGLKGVQIRPGKVTDEEDLPDPNYPNDPTKSGGLRYITSLSERLINEIKGIGKIRAASDEATSFGVEYGYVVGTKTNIDLFLDHYKVADPSKYKLEYKGENVNGKNTMGGNLTAENDYRYISNFNCTSKQKATEETGVVTYDHMNFDSYRLYTFIVTYDEEDEATVNRKAWKIDARSYLRYYDANGKLRVFYNNYGNPNYYGGCMCSYNDVLGLYRANSDNVNVQ